MFPKFLTSFRIRLINFPYDYLCCMYILLMSYITSCIISFRGTIYSRTHYLFEEIFHDYFDIFKEGGLTSVTFKFSLFKENL